DGRPAGGKLVELRVHARAGSERDGYVKNVEAFNRQFEGKYRAIYEPIDGDLYQGQETHIAGGTIGDVHYAHQSNLKFQEYAVKSVAVPLDPFISKDKNFKLSDWPQRAQEAMKIIDNKVFGLPVRGQVAWLFLYWNRDMLRKAGIPEPTPGWTLDDMVNHAKRLVGTVSGEFYPITHNQGGGYETVVANLRRFGGEFFEPSSGPGKKVLLDQAPAIQTYRWFYENTKAGIFAPRTWAAPQFGQGQTAFYFGRLAGERGTVNNAVQGQFEWTFDVVPKGPTGRRGGFLSIDTQQINSASKDRDGAWELLKWLTNKESGVNLALQPEGSLTPGFRKDVYCDDRLLNDSRFPKSAMKANCDNIEQPDSYTYPHNYRLTQPGAIQEVLNKYINDIVDLKQEPTPALMRELTTEIQHILDMPPL
ncbi:MAG TPA: extracellular solute-binding protein, partial [Chloroflexota bacterium]|nr:extracellular solute-binding protein [Chloroflexota bacterium]